ncbi:MAG: hypothetical protein ACK5X3_07530 [Pseudomonadota bacterium]|jgi:hypothetical protein
MWFNREIKQQIRDLKNEVESLRLELEYRTEFRIGDRDAWIMGQQDRRPIVSVKEVVQLILDKEGVELKRQPETPARTTLDMKPPPIINIKVK